MNAPLDPEIEDLARLEYADVDPDGAIRVEALAELGGDMGAEDDIDPPCDYEEEDRGDDPYAGGGEDRHLDSYYESLTDLGDF